MGVMQLYFILEVLDQHFLENNEKRVINLIQDIWFLSGVKSYQIHRRKSFPKEILWGFHVLDHSWLLGSPRLSSRLTSDLSSPALNSPKHTILKFSLHIL